MAPAFSKITPDSGLQQGVGKSGESSQREVFCDCSECQVESPDGRGRWISKALHDFHLKRRALQSTEISRRGRGAPAVRQIYPRGTATRALAGRGRGTTLLGASYQKYSGELKARGGALPRPQKLHLSMDFVPDPPVAPTYIPGHQDMSPNVSPAPSRAISPMMVDPPIDSPSPTQSSTVPPTTDHSNEFIETDPPPRSPYHIQSVPSSPNSSPQAFHRQMTQIIEPGFPQPGSEHVGQEPLPPPPQPIDAYNSSHSLWFVRVILLLVAILHTRHRLSFRVLPANTPMPISFPTVLKKLDLNDRFSIHPICKSCHKLFDLTIDTGISCCGQRIFSDPSQSYIERILGRPPPPPTPLTSAPVQLLSTALPDFLNRGLNEKSCEFWKRDKARPGKKIEVWHGDIWSIIKGCDGNPFFDAQSTSDELRLGITLSLDWFSRKTSVYGPSYSSGVFSFCISNLTHDLRYRTSNLIISAMTPGPVEPNAEQLQNYLKVIVDDLLMLYNDGILISTPQFPNGRRIRVALIGVICDHPAMCKMTGFADKKHTNAPCPKCNVTQADLFSDKANKNGFNPRDGETHRRQCFEYKDLETDTERDEFFQKHGARWTELARLPYFDLVRFTVIDPMHNLLLGIAKAQWYSQFILHKSLRKSTDKTARELEIIHDFLSTFEAPLWAGTLPLKVGEPAGGSLTADEYKFATTTPWAIIIPIVWEEFIDSAKKDFKTAQTKYKADMKAYDKKLAEWTAKQTTNGATVGEQGPSRKRKKTDEPKPTPPQKPSPRMHEDEPKIFLRLSTMLKLAIGRSISEEILAWVTQLLHDYLAEFKRLYGEKDMKPNHHWAVHTTDHLRDHGPMNNFWAFLSERLNKVLKSSNSNGRGGGQLEISMMREFIRDTRLDSIVSAVSAQPESQDVGVIIRRIIGENAEAHGTLQDAAADELSQFHVDTGPIASTSSELSDSARASLYARYNTEATIVQYDLERQRLRVPGTYRFNDMGQFYSYALLDGRRITPLSQSHRKSAGSSIVQYSWKGQYQAGEVVNIFRHAQKGVGEDVLFAEVRWMKNLRISPLSGDDVWDDFPELNMESWTLHEFWAPSHPAAPPTVIPFAEISCQLCRGIVNTTDPPMWVTTSLDRRLELEANDSD